MPAQHSISGSRFIAMNGFMGSGKTLVGKFLAERLGCPLIDLDSFIEEKSGRKIPEIFSTDGESAFRRMEKEALEQILCPGTGMEDCPCDIGCREGEKNVIISLGGGTVTTAECADMIRKRTFCIYLRAKTDTLLENLRKDFAYRPMLRKDGAEPQDENALRARIEELMNTRGSIYESTASLVIDIDGKCCRGIASELAVLLR